MTVRDPQLNDLLETAYDLTAAPDQFEDLITVAKRYLFEGGQSERIREDLPRHADEEAGLERRMASLARLLQIELSNGDPPSNDTFHARISVSPHSLIVTGNAAAAELMDTPFPCPLASLPFDRRTILLIESSLRPKQAADRVQDQIFLTQVEQPMVRSCLALIERPASENGSVEIAITFIHWSADLLGRLKNAFGLTDAQSEILGGFLNHHSQKEIAQQRNLSIETIRDHSRAILQKTNCARMADVVQLCASIAYLLRQASAAEQANSLAKWKTPTDAVSLLTRPDGRTLAWYDYGDGPAALLFIHGYVQGPFFPERFLAEMARLGVRLICPSRPGYGLSSPSTSRKDFDATTVADAVALVESLDLKKLIVVGHQGGTSHAFRIAAALGARTSRVLMIDGGIPIDEKRYLAHMNELARIGAVTSKHAPSIMSMLMSIGLPIYKKRGVERFLRDYHKSAPRDLASLDDPETLRLCAWGCFHSLEQGGEAWVRDGASAMADWDSDFDAMTAPQFWLHPAECAVMGAEFVDHYVAGKKGQSVEIIPETSFNILYAQPEIVAAFIGRHLKI